MIGLAARRLVPPAPSSAFARKATLALGQGDTFGGKATLFASKVTVFALKATLSRAEAEHRYTFMEPGAYRAVVAISNDDCQLDSVEFTINVSESMLAVPNTFTPNGDGVNDEFRVSYRSLKEFHCWVYNRWGHLVYQ